MSNGPITTSQMSNGPTTNIGPKSSSTSNGDTPYLLPIAANLTFVERASGLACRKDMRLVVLAVLVAATPAFAEDDSDPTEPRLVSVDATLAGTNARVTARFALPLDGPAVGMHIHAFALPEKAVVTTASMIVDGTRHRMR